MSSHDDALTHVVNEEQNYLEYLSARVTQVQAELEAKLTAQVLAPNDATLAAEALLARQALSSARAEFKLQSEKVESLKRQRKTTRRKSRTSTPVAVTAPPAKPLNGRAKAIKPTVAALPTITAKPAPAPVLRVAAQAPKLVTPPQAAVPPVAARPVRVIKPTAPAVLAPPVTPIKPKPVAAPAPVINKPIARDPITIQPKVSDTPGAAFHAVQAAKADKAVTRQPPAPVTAPVPALAATSAIVETARKPAPSAPAHPEIHSNAQECPNCMARLPARTNKCRCGFDLTSRFEMPALSLSAADRALLLSNLDYGS